MRIKLDKVKLEEFFRLVCESFPDKAKLARKLHISERTLRDWRRGKFLMKEAAFIYLAKELHLSAEEFLPERLDDFWYAFKGAKLGSRRRQELYGNLGTPEGRRKGGLISSALPRKLGDGFRTLKDIRKPPRSKELAEFMGILIGDGHLAVFQVSVSTNSVTDIDHAHYIQELMTKLFHVTPKLSFKKKQNAVELVGSSKSLVDWLHEQGMPRGNKLAKLRIPTWVKTDNTFVKKFIRGLFDTDGCVFLDHHKIKGKSYYHMGWTITSFNGNLLNELLDELRNLGFRPTRRETQHSVYLRRQEDVHRYFAEIGTSNSKHLKRYQEFSGRVPKRSQRH